MKKMICTILASLMLLSATACGKTIPDTAVTATASAPEQVLIDRLGEIPENVILGDATVAAEYGIDMTDFEADGYILRTVGETTLVFGKTADGLDRGVRAYAKAVEAGNADTLDVTYHEGYRIERLTLAGRDISEYTVYYPENAKDDMRFAAEEFVYLVEKATGVRLPLVVGAPVSPAIEFKTTEDPEFCDDGYRYEVTADGLVFEEAIQYGCEYGVWRFLQHECGWDSLLFGDSYLNEADHIDIPVGTTCAESPAIDFLYTYNPYYGYTSDRHGALNLYRSYNVIDHACHGLQSHNFFEDSSFAKHPCFTDDDAYEVCRGNVEKYLASHYTGPGFQLDVSHYDTSDFCLCNECIKVFKEEGGHAGAVVRFANRLSEDMSELFPGTLYKIFAYAGTNAPPKVTVPNEYIYITFCYDMNCTNHKIDGSECNGTVKQNGRNNSDYAEWFEGWCDLTPNIYVWYYTLGTGVQSYPCYDNIYDDYQYFVANNVKGIFLESEDHGEFSIKRIEHQLIQELNWNIDMTREEFDALKDKLIEKEYGDGWRYIEEYIYQWNLAHDLTECWQCWGWTEEGCWDKRYDASFFAHRFDSFIELFEAAFEGANSKKQENAIKSLYASMLYMGCYSSYFFEYFKGNTERIAVLSDRYDECMEIIRSLGYNPANFPTLTYVTLSDTLEKAAWNKNGWVKYFENIMSIPLPENIPVIPE